MSLVGNRVEASLSPEGALYRCENPILATALLQTQDLSRSIARDAYTSNEYVDPREHGIRLQKLGIRATSHSDLVESRAGIALRILTSAPHYGDTQMDLEGNHRWYPQDEYAPRVHNNCVFNSVIRDFGMLLPKAKVEGARRAMLTTRWLVGNDQNERGYSLLYRNAINGSRVERWGRGILGLMYEVGLPDVAMDLGGVDATMRVGKKSDEAIAIDFTSSEAVVRKKCKSGTHSSGSWGIRNGVLVLWPGVTTSDMGDTFEFDEKVARPIFRKSVKGIIISALKSAEVARIEWKGSAKSKTVLP